MIILITATGVFIIWIFGGFFVQQYKQAKFRKKLVSLEGRVVKLSDELIKTEPYRGYKYGRIEDVRDVSWKELKILSFEVELLPSEKLLLEAEKQAREDFKEQIADYKDQMNSYKKKVKELSDPNNQLMVRYRQQMQQAQMYGHQYNNSYMPQEPQKPEFYFEPDEYELMRIKKKDVKLMPKGFDYVSGTIIKSLDSKKKKGGGKNVRRMPRLFRFALYLALVVLVWDAVLNANNVATFVVQTFILHK